MSSFFHEIPPPRFPRGVSEDDPARVAWVELQMSLYGASIKLWEASLVAVVHPANVSAPIWCPSPNPGALCWPDQLADPLSGSVGFVLGLCGRWTTQPICLSPSRACDR